MPKPLKVLFVSQSAQIAGGEVALRTLIRHLDRDRFEPVVIFPYDGPIKADMEAMGVRTYLSPLSWWVRQPRGHGWQRSVRMLREAASTAVKTPAVLAYSSKTAARRVRALQKIIERERPALVHTNTTTIWESALAARLSGVPHVWHVHEIWRSNPGHETLFPLPRMQRIISDFSVRVVAVSDAVRHSLSAVDDAKLLTIYNGVPDRQAATGDQQAAMPHAVTVLTLGTLLPEKGHDVLLQAAAIARERNPQLHFVLAGASSKPARRSLQAEIKRLKLQDTVHFLGFRDDVPALIEACDFLIVPSYTESFSLALVEAMARSKPAVATACGGPQEIVRDGETGFLTPVGDAAALAEKVLAMAAEASTRQRMGTAARARYKKYFRADIYAARFAALYEEVAAAPLQAGTAREVWEIVAEFERLQGRREVLLRSALLTLARPWQRSKR